MKAKELVEKYGDNRDAICIALFEEFDVFLSKTPDSRLKFLMPSKLNELRIKWKAVANIQNMDPNYFDAFIKENNCTEILELERQFKIEMRISRRY